MQVFQLSKQTSFFIVGPRRPSDKCFAYGQTWPPPSVDIVGKQLWNAVRLISGDAAPRFPRPGRIVYAPLTLPTSAVLIQCPPPPHILDYTKWAQRNTGREVALRGPLQVRPQRSGVAILTCLCRPVMGTLLKNNNDIRGYYDAKQPESLSDWLNKPEIPAPTEIMENVHSNATEEALIDVIQKLRYNKPKGPYDNTKDYLETQYDLLREDTIRPLREAVEHVRADPWLDETDFPNGSNISIYEPVYIVSKVFSPRGLATRVAFSLGRVKKFIRWHQSKRLLTGSLVALSPMDDRFQHKCVLAVVGARPITGGLDQNPPEIDLFFARPEDEEIDPSRRWIMVESRSSFFEASRHTMLALQHMVREPFPLSEHLVTVQREVGPPLYVQKQPYTDLSSVVAMEDGEAFQNINILSDWPSDASYELDESQSKALRRILTKRLAIVQGPPGTGKTYVSVAAIRILLTNMHQDDPPIIVTCQTNHALDQLLRYLAEFEPSFIRLGGRSKDQDKIKQRTLFEVRSNLRYEKSHGDLKSQASAQIRDLTRNMQMLLAPLEANKPPLDHKLLLRFGLITAEQAVSLEMEDEYAMGISPDEPGVQIEQWLGRCLEPCPRPLQPDEFGLDFEEEDFELEQLQELEAEVVARDDDDFENLYGKVTLLGDNKTGRTSSSSLNTDEEIKVLLEKTQDLTTIPVSERGEIYNYFQRQVKQLILVEFRRQAKKYKAAVLNRRIGQWEQDARILRSQRIIGMTTTGLSKYRALITSLRPKIVMVEEAAETLEAPVTVACLPSLEHLILVGDHQQLRPHCQIRDFEDEPFNFNLSLFERMVNNDIELDYLRSQRRMIPEIRRLLFPIYGNALKDHPNVKDADNRPAVEGMGGCNSYFFTHEWPESKDANMSVLNEKEADMIVGFFDYLVLNSVDPKKITVLTFYNGQRKVITKKLRQHRNLRGCASFNVLTVDSYQGEENDIVLLSLARSNKQYQIGFLSVNNRICVALSRAKRGFYLFGNAEMLACESGTWGEVVETMCGKRKDNPKIGPKQRIGYYLPLECTNHSYKSWIQNPSDWELINGGCNEPCRCRLPCGHICMLRCHPFDKAVINCTQKCNKRVGLCGHPCTALCCDPCSYISKPANTIHSYNIGIQPNGSNVKQWKAYANGGAQVDDEEMARKAREKNAKISQTEAKLIDVSIELVKEKKSSNTNLLLDLEDDDTFHTGRIRSKTTLTYEAATNKEGNKENVTLLNLLD
ncbi:P-loop containing nucleoside triphosphate hydrolase protein [Lojkania enalia]|uniref:P-loop containing nucleoside triphosphate hydrolase protein n=1 Tax=Lojkania enalia TaxID=147567 RepID=A0A9P4K9C8_9PLEO|nr:P-loop containing nucleoside triphosphate hydrolase protein [Didymosphaeria enalia]